MEWCGRSNIAAGWVEVFCLVGGAAGANGADGATKFQRPPPTLMGCDRGEIARRIIRTANHHGLETIAIYTQVGRSGFLPASSRWLSRHMHNPTVPLPG